MQKTVLVAHAIVDDTVLRERVQEVSGQLVRAANRDVKRFLAAS